MEKTSKIRIFVDMDGVLSDWFGGACLACNVDDNDPKIRNRLKAGEYLDSIIGEGKMWNIIKERGSEWWATLMPLPWAYDLYSFISSLDCEIGILSSPGSLYKYPEVYCQACFGKGQWIKNKFKDAKLVLTQYKEFCASPYSLLIDDSSKKVNKFIEYGGSGILWPNQYQIIDNEIDVNKILIFIKENIAVLKCRRALDKY